uniref:E3 ubiquitin-protein ligase n=1 Tax=Oncorhynchus tshawytscha TaxID=74940 RepID=A0A8C8IGG3_ONCTS
MPTCLNWFVIIFMVSLLPPSTQKWLQVTDLYKEVYHHLARYVPKIYCLGPNLNPQSEDLLAQMLLQAPLEWYLCGEDPSTGLAKLEQNNQPSQLCGHVFKVGEPTYSCRECAADPTCVLCMQCFLGSVHKEHRYRMTTSGGGGFCDCGDTEAWKKGPYCQKHEPNISDSCQEVSISYDTYYCMLFNDEVHTYEQVIYTLQKAVNCTQKEAVSFATTVDRDVSRARNVYHQLFMSSLLMDLKYKKLFAIQFAKNYERLQSDYVKDDHDREFSVTDLSVQMFTVPSLARMLITEENLMTTIIRTFVDHLRHRDLQGRFQFERYTAQQAFKFRRVQSLIGDLKYVLISRPTEWSDQLREKFLEGLDTFLELLKCMQGMDPVVRQVGQHIEMEPEWEAAFTLQMKLTHIISMIQEWCATDERVLIEAYKKCLTALTHCHSGFADGEQPITLSMCGHSVDTIRYCVSQEKVSIHLPVSRLLAGLHVLLSKMEVAYRFPEQLPPPMLIEHPLRCLVLCAQVHAGMWRRNGFSLVNQIYYYHNVKCRVEMFDKDLIMLQAGASMMDPNHFLMIVLSRFELYHIFSSVCSLDVVQQNNTLTEEMLHLIMMVVGERFEAGIGQVEGCDEIKREILHQLCIRPMAHSELVKALPENENKETGMERVIDCVASFKKPGVTGRGLYELRPECAKQFNLYFHHYSRADQSKAEEAQRKLKRQNGEDTALPPPVLPPFCPLFASLVNILQCDVLLGMLGAVLQWAVEPSAGHWSESMLQRVSETRTTLCCTDTSASPLFQTACDKDKAERKRKAEIARLRREKVMAQMSEMQRHFINENKELFQQSLEELDIVSHRSCSPASSDAALACVGPRRSRPREKRQVVTCILCQEEQEIRADGKAMVLAAFVQRSTVMSKNRTRPPHDPKRYDPLFMHPDLSFGTHTGSCGHIMHSHCWQRYFEAVQAKEQRRQQRLRVHTSYDVGNGEFLCPLCECLSNTVIPLLPRTMGSSRYPVCLSLTNTRYFEVRLSSHVVSSPFLPVSEYWNAEHSVKGTHMFPSNPYSSTIKEMLTTFGTATYKVGLKVHPNEQDPRIPIMCWSSCAYTIQSIERLLVDEKKPLFGSLPCRQVMRSSFNSNLVVLSYGSVHSQDSSGLSVDAVQLHLFHLITVAHMVQILLTSGPGKERGNPITVRVRAGSARVSVSKHRSLPEVGSGWHLWRCVKTGILPYLRGAALFFHHLHGVPAPPELHGQYNSNSLIDLPDDYSALINQASSFTCPKSGGDKSRAPTLCLVCGSMLCSQSYCCQTELEGEDVGACTAHTFACGAGVGIFLRVRESQVLFLAGKTKGCFYAPPYLDDYGETDQGLRRGNPLHLCHERYRKIQKLWRQHSITEEIGHAQEANQTLVGIDWQHL